MENMNKTKNMKGYERAIKIKKNNTGTLSKWLNEDEVKKYINGFNKNNGSKFKTSHEVLKAKAIKSFLEYKGQKSINEIAYFLLNNNIIPGKKLTPEEEYRIIEARNFTVKEIQEHIDEIAELQRREDNKRLTKESEIFQKEYPNGFFSAGKQVFIPFMTGGLSFEGTEIIVKDPGTKTSPDNHFGGLAFEEKDGIMKISLLSPFGENKNSDYFKTEKALLDKFVALFRAEGKIVEFNISPKIQNDGWRCGYNVTEFFARAVKTHKFVVGTYDLIEELKWQASQGNNVKAWFSDKNKERWSEESILARQEKREERKREELIGSGKLKNAQEEFSIVGELLERGKISEAENEFYRIKKLSKNKKFLEILKTSPEQFWFNEDEKIEEILKKDTIYNKNFPEENSFPTDKKVKELLNGNTDPIPELDTFPTDKKVKELLNRSTNYNTPNYPKGNFFTTKEKKMKSNKKSKCCNIL